MRLAENMRKYQPNAPELQEIRQGGAIRVGSGMLDRFVDVCPDPGKAILQLIDNAWTLSGPAILAGEEPGRMVEIHAELRNQELVVSVISNTLMTGSENGGATAALGKSATGDDVESGFLNQIHEGIKLAMGALGEGGKKPACVTMVGVRHVEEKNIEGGWKNFSIVKQGGNLKETEGSVEYLTYANHEGFINKDNVPVLKEMKLGNRSWENTFAGEFNKEIQKIIQDNPGSVEDTRADTVDFLDQVRIERLIDLANASRSNDFRGCFTNCCIHGFGRDRATNEPKMWMTENDILYFTGKDKAPGSLFGLLCNVYLPKQQGEMVFMGRDVFLAQQEMTPKPFAIRTWNTMKEMALKCKSHDPEATGEKPRGVTSYVYQINGVDALQVALANTEEKLLKSTNALTECAQFSTKARASDPEACAEYVAKYNNASVWTLDSRVIGQTPTAFHHPGELFPPLEAGSDAIAFLNEHVKDQNYREEGHGLSMIRTFLVGHDNTEQKFAEFLVKKNEEHSPGLEGKLGRNTREFMRCFTPPLPSHIKCQKEGCCRNVSKRGLAERPYCEECLLKVPEEELSDIPEKGEEKVPLRWSRHADQLLWGFHTAKYVEDMSGKAFTYGQNKDHVRSGSEDGANVMQMMRFLNRCTLAHNVFEARDNPILRHIAKVKTVWHVVEGLNRDKAKLELLAAERRRRAERQGAFDRGMDAARQQTAEETRQLREHIEKEEAAKKKKREDLDAAKAKRDARAASEKKKLADQVMRIATTGGGRKRKELEEEPVNEPVNESDSDEGVIFEQTEAEKKAEGLNKCVLVPAHEWRANGKFSAVVRDLNELSQSLPFKDEHVGYFRNPKSVYAGQRKFQRTLLEPQMNADWPDDAKMLILEQHATMQKMYSGVISSLKIEKTSAWEFANGPDPDVSVVDKTAKELAAEKRQEKAKKKQEEAEAHQRALQAGAATAVPCKLGKPMYRGF